VRSLCGASLLFWTTTPCAAQESGTGQPKVAVRSTLVIVPVLATTKEEMSFLASPPMIFFSLIMVCPRMFLLRRTRTRSPWRW